MDFIQSVTEENLPAEFKTVIVCEKSKPQSGEFYLRCAITNIEECNDWVSAFSQNTSTQWKTRRTKPNGSVKIVCQKVFLCHHSAYQKRPIIDEKNNNKRGISKNTDCSAQLTITVKVTTAYTKRNDLFTKDGMPGIIILKGRHNHPLDSPAALKHLSTLKNVRNDFQEYFNMGMNISSACQYHENKILFEGENEKLNDDFLENESLLANAHFNPTKRAVEYWYMLWRKSRFGSRDGTDMLPMLNEKMQSYASDGIIMKYYADPFALVIVTPIMQRIHQCDFSSDILFVDSTSCCDHENYAITFLLSATPCGAIPCGVLITKDQTMNSFGHGFRLFQDAVLEKIGGTFNNQNYPSVLMTDNCSAEIGGAKTVWPDSISLLCIFHVLQYVLRWIQDGTHKIAKEHQRDLMSTFQTILYCTDKTEAENAFESAMAIGAEYPAWQDYLRDQYKNKEKWCLAYRVGVTSHHTNNFAEISIRLFKENILDRVKAYNLIALLDFIAITMEVFYKRKLRDFYNSRDRRKHLYLQGVFKKADYLEKESITKIDDHIYEVPSENTTEKYIVDSNKVTCSCKAGKIGKLCKHLAAVYKFYDSENNFPSVTIEGRQKMAFVALGKENMPSYEYFLPLHVNAMTNQEREMLNGTTDAQERTEAQNMATIETQSMENEDTTDCNNNDENGYVFDDLIWHLTKLNEKFGSADLAHQGVNKFVSRLRKMKSPGQWVSFLHTAGKSVPLRRAIGAKIKVQPTAIQRRKGKKNSPTCCCQPKRKDFTQKK